MFDEYSQFMEDWFDMLDETEYANAEPSPVNSTGSAVH